MKRVHLILFISLTFLAGCTGFSSHHQLSVLKNAPAVGSAFTRALSKEYHMFATFEQQKMFDYADAGYFAKKGLRAAGGEVVIPEVLSFWDLSDSVIEEVRTARYRLLDALDDGGRLLAPFEAARAQARFDCWVEQQEEVFQADDIASCKKAFFTALVKLEAVVDEEKRRRYPDQYLKFIEPDGTSLASVPEKLAEIMIPDALFGFGSGVEVARADIASDELLYQSIEIPAFEIASAVPTKKFLLFFSSNKIEQDAKVRRLLNIIARDVQDEHPKRLLITGHTDLLGPESYNQQLSEKRANLIREALVKRGVNADIVVARGKGESDPLIQTPDNVGEPVNRRVEIAFL